MIKRFIKWLFSDCYRTECRCCGAKLHKTGGIGIDLSRTIKKYTRIELEEMKEDLKERIKIELDRIGN